MKLGVNLMIDGGPTAKKPEPKNPLFPNNVEDCPHKEKQAVGTSTEHHSSIHVVCMDCGHAKSVM